MEAVDASERSAPPDHWMPAFAGMTVGCGGFAKEVDGAVTHASGPAVTPTVRPSD